MAYPCLLRFNLVGGQDFFVIRRLLMKNFTNLKIDEQFVGATVFGSTAFDFDDDNIGGAIVQSDGTLITGGVPAEPFTEVMLIPQTMDASNRVSLKVLYQLKMFDGEDKWEDVELETELPYGTWEPNRRYTYNVVLSSVKDITFYYIQTKITPWGAPQVGGTIIIK